MTAAHQATLSITNSQSLLKLMSIEPVMPSNHLILCHPLLFLPWIFPNIRVFSSESVLCIRWPKYWSFSFSNSPSNEYSGLISFRMNWLDLLAVQVTLKSLLQHHSSKVQNSSSWWWLISSMFLTRTSCCKTTHAHGYYGAWPGWAVSVSVLPLTNPPKRLGTQDTSWEFGGGLFLL